MIQITENQLTVSSSCGGEGTPIEYLTTLFSLIQKIKRSKTMDINLVPHKFLFSALNRPFYPIPSKMSNSIDLYLADHFE